jgi:hypothetical protein
LTLGRELKGERYLRHRGFVVKKVQLEPIILMADVTPAGRAAADTVELATPGWSDGVHERARRLTWAKLCRRPIEIGGMEEKCETAHERSAVTLATKRRPELLAVQKSVSVDKPENADVPLGDLDCDVTARARSVALVLPTHSSSRKARCCGWVN